jgi:hypothetical protein
VTGTRRDAPGARTPEELETLFEDALVLRDHQAVAELFEDGAVLSAGNERPGRGGKEIARLALATWEGDRTYVADPRRVMQVRDLALIVVEQGINVARRDRDGGWRYVIVLRSVEDGERKRQSAWRGNQRKRRT